MVSATSDQKLKEHERSQLAADVAEYVRKGGVIQELGGPQDLGVPGKENPLRQQAEGDPGA